MGILSLAGAQQRNFVVMEVKGNLLKEEREAVLAKFPSTSFTKVAQVMVGEPTKDLKKKAHDSILKQKQEALDIQHRVKMAEKARQKAAAKQQKEFEKKKKAAEKARQKQLAEAKKKAEEAKK